MTFGFVFQDIMSKRKNAEDLEECVLKELTCPVCLEYMFPPINLCWNGHSICHKCRDAISRCPLCRGSLLRVSNLSLEMLAAEVYFPCRNTDSGCDVRARYLELKEHEQHCRFQKKPCPFFRMPIEACCWSGLVSETVEHLRTAHMEDIELLGDDCSVKFKFYAPEDLGGPERRNRMLTYFHSSVIDPEGFTRNGRYFASTARVILAFDECFYVVFKMGIDRLLAVVIHLGYNAAAKFKYRFSLASKKGDVSFTLATPSYMSGVDEIFEKGNCVLVAPYTPFVDNGSLKPKIEIFKDDNALQESTQNNEGKHENITQLQMCAIFD